MFGFYLIQGVRDTTDWFQAEELPGGSKQGGHRS